jgi:hypothetical protein
MIPTAACSRVPDSLQANRLPITYIITGLVNAKTASNNNILYLLIL